MSRYRKLSTISSIVIHCADTPNGRPTSLTEIDSWHYERNFKRAYPARLGEEEWSGCGFHQPHLRAIGYHTIIHIDGTVETGRSLRETGAHTLDKKHPRGSAQRSRFNRNAIAICLIGRDKFTPEQWESLRINITATKKDLNRNLDVVGHCQIDSNKTCPGFDVVAWVAGRMQPLEGHIL